MYGNVNLSGDNLQYLQVRTDWDGNCNCSANYQPFNGGSYSLTVGSNTGLLIDASSITIGSVAAGLIVATPLVYQALPCSMFMVRAW